jgi:hypothetical protein
MLTISRLANASHHCATEIHRPKSASRPMMFPSRTSLRHVYATCIWCMNGWLIAMRDRYINMEACGHQGVCLCASSCEGEHNGALFQQFCRASSVIYRGLTKRIHTVYPLAFDRSSFDKMAVAFTSLATSCERISQ